MKVNICSCDRNYFTKSQRQGLHFAVMAHLRNRAFRQCLQPGSQYNQLGCPCCSKLLFTCRCTSKCEIFKGEKSVPACTGDRLFACTGELLPLSSHFSTIFKTFLLIKLKCLGLSIIPPKSLFSRKEGIISFSRVNNIILSLLSNIIWGVSTLGNVHMKEGRRLSR